MKIWRLTQHNYIIRLREGISVTSNRFRHLHNHIKISKKICFGCKEGMQILQKCWNGSRAQSRLCKEELGLRNSTRLDKCRIVIHKMCWWKVEIWRKIVRGKKQFYYRNAFFYHVNIHMIKIQTMIRYGYGELTVLIMPSFPACERQKWKQLKANHTPTDRFLSVCCTCMFFFIHASLSELQMFPISLASINDYHGGWGMVRRGRASPFLSLYVQS